MVSFNAQAICLLAPANALEQKMTEFVVGVATQEEVSGPKWFLIYQKETKSKIEKCFTYFTYTKTSVNLRNE